jgi:hypothetical protein
MDSYYADITTSNYANAPDLSLAIKNYTDALVPATSGFVDLNYKIFYPSSNIHHPIKTLSSEMAQLERRNLIQCWLMDPILLLFGFSIEPSIAAYSALWIEFLSAFAEPAQQLTPSPRN